MRSVYSSQAYFYLPPHRLIGGSGRNKLRIHELSLGSPVAYMAYHLSNKHDCVKIPHWRRKVHYFGRLRRRWCCAICTARALRKIIAQSGPQLRGFPRRSLRGVSNPSNTQLLSLFCLSPASYNQSHCRYVVFLQAHLYTWVRVDSLQSQTYFSICQISLMRCGRNALQGSSVGGVT